MEEKKEKRIRWRQTRIEAIKVKAKEGVTYADELSNMKRNVNPETTRAEIMGIRRTRAGDILVKVKRGEKTEQLREAKAQVLEGKAVVETRSKPCQIEIRDLDESITQEEV